MNFKQIINGATLLIALGLIGYSQFDKKRSVPTSADSPAVEKKNLEVWSVKPGSIYDGDTLRDVKGKRDLNWSF